MEFGALLKSWRTGRKLSLRDLALASGISGATLARWETGRTQPRMDEFNLVLDALQVPLADRRRALGLMETPRAVQQMRGIPGSGPPLSGDLLRAMRQRNGWTQQETARRAGIRQGTLAKWESSVDWPSPDRIHLLCYVLGAREEELLALTRGSLVIPPDRFAEPDRGAVEHRVVAYLFYSPIADLEFMALEGQLWNAARTHETSQMQLTHAYGCHARFLAVRGRFREAEPYVDRTLNLANAGYRDEIGWSSALMAASRMAAAGGRAVDYRRAIGILQSGIERSEALRRPEYRAWATSEVALYLQKMGSGEPAVHQSRRAVEMADAIDPVELWWRRVDHARILLQTGHAGAALEICAACLSTGRGPVERLPFILLGAEALHALARAAEAAEWLGIAFGLIEGEGLLGHYRAEAEALARRIEGPATREAEAAGP